MGAANIHPTALVAPEAQLAADVTVGAYSVIGPRVRIGAGTVVGPHVVLEGRTTIGARNQLFQFASVGAVPQDLKYHGEDSELVAVVRATRCGPVAVSPTKRWLC